MCPVISFLEVLAWGQLLVNQIKHCHFIEASLVHLQNHFLKGSFRQTDSRCQVEDVDVRLGQMVRPELCLKHVLVVVPWDSLCSSGYSAA